MGSKLNRAWHEKHPMPPNATLEERAQWHVAHTEHCGCRPMPKSVIDYLASKGKAPTSGLRPRPRAGK